MRISFALLAVAISLVALACQTAAAPLDAGPRPDTGPHPMVEIGAQEGGVFTRWNDGDVVAEQFGPQGGVMVTPSVAIDGALVSGDAPALDVVISNFTLPDRAPLGQFPILGPMRVPFARLGTHLVGGAFFDQIGWSDTSGRHLLVRARVTGMGIDATGEVEIVVGTPQTAHPDAGVFDGTGDAG